MQPKWLKTLIDATQKDELPADLQAAKDRDDPVAFDPEDYASRVYRKDDASLGMPEVTIEEDAEWSFEGEVFGQSKIEVYGLHVQHRAGIASAMATGVDLGECFACRLDFRTPNLTPTSLPLLTEVFPPEIWRGTSRLWHLGFDHYEFIRDYGTHAVTVFLTSRTLEEATYSGPGPTTPPCALRLAYYPLHRIPTPQWITHERTPGPGTEL